MSLLYFIDVTGRSQNLYLSPFPEIRPLPAVGSLFGYNGRACCDCTALHHFVVAKKAGPFPIATNLEGLELKLIASDGI